LRRVDATRLKVSELWVEFHELRVRHDRVGILDDPRVRTGSYEERGPVRLCEEFRNETRCEVRGADLRPGQWDFVRERLTAAYAIASAAASPPTT
jgi:hypothetical protein